MHTGPLPTGYGLFASEIPTSWPVDSITNAEIELFVVPALVFVVLWFNTYRYLPFESVRLYTGLEDVGRLGAGPSACTLNEQLAPGKNGKIRFCGFVAVPA